MYMSVKNAYGQRNYTGRLAFVCSLPAGDEVVILCRAPSCPHSSLRMAPRGESILFKPAQQTTTCFKTRIYFT
jgi:hypothetical protein